ncbi:MAG: hypothetical protein IPG45_24555 [Deltaproteobacteria bacterium]|nr:hypothetical protein [Deltaproteobacteria bacterium]
MLLRLSCLFAGLSAVLAVALGGCNSGPVASANRVLTATVALSNETALIVNAPVAIELRGARRLDQIIVRAEVTITASSADTAERQAAALTLVEERVAADRVLRLTLPGSTDDTTGKITLEVPADLDLGINGGATIDASGMDGSYDVRALSTVLIADAQRDVVVRTSGGIRLTTRASPGTTADLEQGVGDIELILPALPSVQFQAATGNGQIVIAHPQLPPWSGGNNAYQVSVNGGLSAIRLVTQSGNVVIRGE